jgi:uncharacterized surface protein with fasciclin (FAS1) repeats
MMQHALLSTLVGAAALGSVAFAGPHKREAPAAAKDLVDTAVADGRFTTLVKAVQAADLVATLKGKGPFTVFAPTDEAFAKIPADQLKSIIADKKLLTSILTYHVVPGRLMAADVLKAKSLKSVEGRSLEVKASKDGATIAGAKIVITDVATSNGVIHVIDTVMVPR